MKKMIALVLVSILVLLPTAAFCDELTDLMEILQQQKTITVSGSAFIQVQPDCATLHMAVETFNTDFSAAVKENRDAVQKVTEAMVSLGLKQENVIKASKETTTTYSGSENAFAPQRIKGYRVKQSFTVVTYDVSMIGEIVNQAVAAGATAVGEIAFGCTDADEVYNTALSMAIEEAIQKAKRMASVSNASVGEVISLVEKDGSYPGLKVAVEDLQGDNADKWIKLITTGMDFSANVDMVFKLE